MAPQHLRASIRRGSEVQKDIRKSLKEVNYNHPGTYVKLSQIVELNRFSIIEILRLKKPYYFI